MQRLTAYLGKRISGVLSGFDRLVFRGYIRAFCCPEMFETFLAVTKVLHKDFGRFTQRVTEKVCARAKSDAERHGVPYRYLASCSSDKETIARRFVEEHSIRGGPICVLGSVEPCKTWQIHRSRESKRIELRHRRGKCQYLYFYAIDPEFGFMHVRLQTWFPFQVQVYINGREYLARQLDRQHRVYRRADNCFPHLPDVAHAQDVMDRLLALRWQSVLDAFADRIHPTLPDILQGFRAGYSWSVYQSEWATDFIFKDQADLAAIYPEIVRVAMTNFSSDDVMKFLGKKAVHTFRGEVVTSFKRRVEGVRVKHWVGFNSLKTYDKPSNLRIEATINDPSEFKVIRCAQGKGPESKSRRELRKSIADLRRRAKVSHDACSRYANAIGAAVHEKKPVHQIFESVARPAHLDGRRVRAIHPLDPNDLALLKAVGRGEFALNGFRNQDIARLLFPIHAGTPEERRKRSAKTTRLLRLLRAHKLIQKQTRSNRYLVTQQGHAIIAAAIALASATVDSLTRCA